MIAIALLLCLQESTQYYTDAYAPNYLIRRQPWQAIAVDSKGQVFVAHPYVVGAGNRSVPSGRKIQIFDPRGEELARYDAPNGVLTFGLAIDERRGRIYSASNFQHVRVFGWDGKALTLLPEVIAKKEGRCVGVSFTRDGMLLTADLAENKVFRFYEGGAWSSFGSGPGGGSQGFNDVRRVFESPKTGALFVLDKEAIRKFSPIGGFVKRIGDPIAEESGVLAMGPDGTLLAGSGRDLTLFDEEGTALKTVPIDSRKIVDAAIGKDGRIYVIPRGEEHCYAAYDPDGKLLFQRGADFDRLTVVRGKITFSNALQLGLLTGAQKKAAEARPQSPKINSFELPNGRLRYTLAATVDGPGLAVDVQR
jgi:hypothetical protein